MRYVILSTILLVQCTVVSSTFAQKSKSDSLYQLLSGTDISFVPQKYKFLYTAGFNKAQAKQLRDSLDVVSVSMKRSGCLGTCPSFEATFDLDGTASYIGHRYVDRKGSYTGSIKLRQYGRLCYLIEKMRFKALHKVYESSWTDGPSFTIRVKYKDGTHKKVYCDDNYGPIELWGLSKTIDALVTAVEWQKE